MPAIWRDANARRNVLLPVPLRPTRPYRWPAASVSDAFTMSSAPPLDTSKFSSCR